VSYARFADDLVILIDAYKRHDWLVGAVDKRLREEFGKLQVEINDEKSRTVDLERGECFGFLGFEFRYLRGLSGAMRPHYTPKLKKRTALVRALKEVFRRHRSQSIERVINLINPMLRGWVNYFAVGHSSECFSFIKNWVEKKSGAIWCMLRNERASAGNDGIGGGCMTLWGCSTPTECDATDRKLPQQDRSHKRWGEANGGAQCGKSACCVRRGGDWKRGTVERPLPARQSSTLPMSGMWKRSHGRTSKAPPDERGGDRYVRT
jgi:hypothetical protein